MTAYDSGADTVFYHRYHIVRATRYRYKVLEGDPRSRIRDIIRRGCGEPGMTIVKGVLSRDHVHMPVSIPPKRSVAGVVQRIKGRSSHRVQQEAPSIRGRHFRARGYVCPTAGNSTEDVVLQYLEKHGTDATGASR